MTDEMCMHPVVVAVELGIANGETTTVWLCKNTDCKKEFIPVSTDLLTAVLEDVDFSQITLPTPEEVAELLPQLLEVFDQRAKEIRGES